MPEKRNFHLGGVVSSKVGTPAKEHNPDLERKLRVLCAAFYLYPNQSLSTKRALGALKC